MVAVVRVGESERPKMTSFLVGPLFYDIEDHLDRISADLYKADLSLCPREISWIHHLYIFLALFYDVL